MVSGASPVRTCVGCRSRAPSSELLRVVAVGEVTDGGVKISIIADPRRRRPGRGANLHPDLTCLAKAERRKAFGRALRVTGVIDTGPLREYIDDATSSDTDSRVGTINMSTR